MRNAVLSAVVVLFGSGCNQLFIEGHVSALCQHLPAQSFHVPPGLANLAANPPANLAALTASMEKSFAFDISMQLPKELSGADLKVALSNVSLNARGATGDFGFLKKAQVTLQSPVGSSLPEHPVVDYSTERAPRTAPRSLNFVGDDFDLAPYLQAGVMSYVVKLEGSLPMSDLTADVDACAEVSLRYNYAQ